MSKFTLRCPALVLRKMYSCSRTLWTRQWIYKFPPKREFYDAWAKLSF